MSDIIWYLSFFVWLTSLSVIISSSIHVTANGIISFFFFFNWRIVVLQCCVSFRYTAKRLSYTYTYIHSFPVSFPIQIISECWVEFPVLYSRSFLIIHFIYSSVYMLIPNSYFIPPPHVSPLVTISLFLRSMSLFLFCK